MGSFFNIHSSAFFENEASYDAVIIFLDGGKDDRLLVSEPGKTDRREMAFVNRTHHHCAIKDSHIYNNRLLEGGNLIKVLEANLLMESNEIYDNELLKLHGGIHVSYGHLELNENEFFSSKNASFYYDL